jgi:hypothetical protein
MLFLWISVSIALYLLPLAVVALQRAERSRTVWISAFDLPLWVACDLFCVLLLARFVRLEIATLLTRAVWLAALPVVIWRRRVALEHCFELARLRAWVLPVIMAAVGVAISLRLSIPCAIWDRHWHIPLVASLRGQTFPFHNVFDLPSRLDYHYAGDVLAAMLQSLSFAHLHASNTLSRAHDLMFAFIGLFLGLLLPPLNIRRGAAILAVLVACLTSGPATLPDLSQSFYNGGYSITGMLNLSYRSHASLSFLLIISFFGAVMLPIAAPRATPPPGRLLTLFAVSALLAFTDELSLAVMGTMLAGVWVFAPEVIDTDRKRGLAILAALAFTEAAAVLIFGGTLSPEAPRIPVSFRELHLPGFYKPALSLSSPSTLRVLFFDLFVVFMSWIAGLLAAVTVRRRSIWLSFLAYCLLAGISLFLFSSISVHDNGTQNHRFVTAVIVLSPLFCAYWISQAYWRPKSSLVTIVVFLVFILPCLSTLEWLSTAAINECTAFKGFWGPDLFYSTDCRESTGAEIGEIATPTYIEESIWYMIGGCRPLYAAGPDRGNGQDGFELLIGTPVLGFRGVNKMQSWIAGTSPLTAFCERAPSKSLDPICREQRKSPENCSSINARVKRCVIARSPAPLVQP